MSEKKGALASVDESAVWARRVNGILIPVQAKLSSQTKPENVYRWQPEANGIYQRTLNFVLFTAIRELFSNIRVAIGHSISNGFFFDFYSEVPVNHSSLEEIAEKMHWIITKNFPITYRILNRERALAFFSRRAQHDLCRLIRYSPRRKFPVYSCLNFANIEFFPLAPATGYVQQFALKPLPPGFVIFFPDLQKQEFNTDIGKTSKLIKIYQETRNWEKILGISDLSRLNQIIKENKSSDLIKIAEAFHEKKIAQIADAISQKDHQVRIVLISGPSSAGKTTFAKRLAIQLKVNGFNPVSLSTDDYFVDRELCPRDEKGEYDFESLEAIDLGLFNEHLLNLLNGKEVAVPKFDFPSGKRLNKSRRLHLTDDQILIIEGIHSLNPRLTSEVAEELKFKVFISALTQVTISDYSRISTTDNRLLRRLIRDNIFRGNNPENTLLRFPKVIEGERKNIFPFQENCHIMFNSWLVYELPVLKKYALPLLKTIKAGSPAFSEAQRLITILNLFHPLETKEIPPTSILREFIGGSTFTY